MKWAEVNTTKLSQFQNIANAYILSTRIDDCFAISDVANALLFLVLSYN